MTPELAALAARHGIDTAYTGADGQHHDISSASVRAVLDALGVTDDDAPALERVVQPVSVAWDGAMKVHVSVPEDRAAGSFRLEVGGERVDGKLEDLRVRSRRDGVVDLAIEREGLALGRHEATLKLGRDKHDLVVISAPRRAFDPEGLREMGVFAPVYGLRSERSLGVGDLSDLKSLMEGAADHGATFVGTLPLLAQFDAGEPYAPSPYSPASRLFFAERHLDLRGTPEWERSRAAKTALAAREDELARLLDQPFVDHAGVARARRPILDALARTFFRDAAGKKAAERAMKADPELLPYAQHRARTESVQKGWPAWKDKEAMPPSSNDAVRTHLYAQVRLRDQLTQLADEAPGLGLYLDLPVGVHPDSYDCWKNRDLFLDLSVGAPPDPLAAQGQDWGFPPIDPRASRANGHAHLYEVLKRHCEIAGVLRVDHVMGFHRLWVIPRGHGATDGAYLRYPADELWALLCLLSVEHECLVVGEDLGTVPGTVRTAMQRRRARRMYVGQFGLSHDESDAIREPPGRCVASVNTHDTPTFATWMAADDVDLLEGLGHLTADGAQHEREGRAMVTGALTKFLGVEGAEAPDVHAAFAAHLGGSDAELVQVTLEDTWGETRPQNVPGTFKEVPNFAGRLAHTTDTALKLAQPTLERVKAMRDGKHHDLERGTRWIDWLSDDDRYLWAEGTARRAHAKLGAHPTTVDGVEGTHFAVWAPSARSVSVVGDFNHWSAGEHVLHPSHQGIWTGFIAGAGPGHIYKYAVEGEGGHRVDKADPFAARTEEPPKTGSVIADLSYEWRDDEWLAGRRERQSLDKPISIYEVHAGSWMRGEDGRWLTYVELGDKLGKYASEMGFTHVELMPVAEHPFYGSWGYQVAGYFAPSARYGTPQDFMAFVDKLHEHGVGVIVDWVPAHFPNDEHGLARFDGTSLFEHADPRLGFHPDWKTAVFNYGRHEVRSFLISNAIAWLERFHIDGLRVDAVASMLYRDYSREPGEWIPNQYGGRENLEAVQLFQGLSRAVKDEYPGALLIAEESTAWPGVTGDPDHGGLGFDLKWDMGWMHDTLVYMARDPIHRQHHQGELTFRAVYANTEKFCLSLSHDEVVHGKGTLLTRMPGDDWQRFANLRLLFGYQWGLPGKKLIFMGQELGAWHEWNHEGHVDWAALSDEKHRGMQAWMRRLNALLQKHPALCRRDFDEGGFSWITLDDAANSVLAFGRHTDRAEDDVIVVCNFTPVVRDYRVGVAYAGSWREVASSDDPAFGGSGVLNGTVHTSDEGAHGRPHAIEIKLPPLGVAIFARA
jgi:alpha-1,4-glucan:alpha-1,4-glucan 6-glycosyltransferase/4-alpha-glucanotransferase